MTPVTWGLSHTPSHTYTPPVSDTQSPSVSPARLGVTAQCPSHTFTRARPPHAPCHPQSRADTVQNPPFPAAPRCSRTEAPPSRPATGSGVNPSSWVPPTPSHAKFRLLPLAHLLTTLRSARCGEDAQPGGLRDAREALGRDRTGQESGAAASAARENFLGAAERGCGPSAPSLPGRQHQLRSASDAAPGPR